MTRTHDISRRRFLKGAAALVAAPYVLPARATRRAAPSERITLGLIGLGNMGNNHVHALVHNRDVHIVALCDVKRWRRDRYKNLVENAYAEAQPGYRGCDTYNDYEQVLARDDIDAVVIAVPDHWHAIIAMAACRAGKDVYCEKPLTLTVHEAGAVVAAARRYNRVFQTGSQQRSSASFRRACELARSGRVGPIREVIVGFHDGKAVHKNLPAQPVPDGLDWERWLGPTPWYPYNEERCSGAYGGGWRFIRDYSGGMMTDWGAHHFDIAQWGLGMDGSGPVEIIPPGHAETGQITYRYANGVTMRRGPAHGIRFVGDEGWLEVNRGHHASSHKRLWDEPLRPDDVHLTDSTDHHANWIECIRTRRRPIADVAIGASSVTVCHLGNIAIWLGRTLQWDPQQREIVGDELAARWLDRPKRAPYRLHA